MATHMAKTQAKNARRARRTKSLVSRILAHVALTISSLLIAFPFFWMITRALMSAEELRAYRFRLIPQAMQWSNFREFWQATPNWSTVTPAAMMALFTKYRPNNGSASQNSRKLPHCKVWGIRRKR